MTIPSAGQTQMCLPPPPDAAKEALGQSAHSLSGVVTGAWSEPAGWVAARAERNKILECGPIFRSEQCPGHLFLTQAKLEDAGNDLHKAGLPELWQLI